MRTTIILSFDKKDLERKRYLRLQQGQGRYSIPKQPVYQPAHQFLKKYEQTGYPFIMQQLLHATAVKMLRMPSSTPYSKTLFAAGGLYLTLDQKHPDLAIKPIFGDFTSGFSHQFGVALAVMSMSEAFGIPWDRLVPIPVKGKRVLDYVAEFPNDGRWLRLEAKGATSISSRSSARYNAYRKKLENPKTVKSAKRQFPEPTAMIGVITQAARGINDSGVLEIIDPEYETNLAARQRDNQIAGRYFHYAGVARFAGLYNVAARFVQQADALIEKQSRYRLTGDIRINDYAVFERFERQFVGVQWRFGESEEPQRDIWFYHGAELNRIRTIITHNEFPPTTPYRRRILAEDDMMTESLLPDGSYFGIGLGPKEDILRVDRRSPELPELVGLG